MMLGLLDFSGGPVGEPATGYHFMTLGHLVFAIGFSLYIVVVAFIEERSMPALWGAATVPRLSRGKTSARDDEGAA